MLYPLEFGAWWRLEITDDDVGTSQKVVTVIGEGPVPGRPDVDGYNVLSNREKGHGHRWQSIDPETGHVLRHVDEWFEEANGDAKWVKTEVYCPFKYRTPDPLSDFDSPQTWLCAQITRVDGIADAPCQDLVLDPDTCEPIDGQPDDLLAGCAIADCDDVNLDPQLHQSYWQAEEVGDVPVQAGTFLAYRVGKSKDEDFTEEKVFYFSRGVGKVMEDDLRQSEELLECCLPASGCDVKAPGIDHRPH